MEIVSNLLVDIHPNIIIYLPQCRLLSRHYEALTRPKWENFRRVRDDLTMFIDMISLGCWRFVPTFNYWAKDCVITIQTDRLNLQYIQSVPVWYMTSAFDNEGDLDVCICVSDEEDDDSVEWSDGDLDYWS